MTEIVPATITLVPVKNPEELLEPRLLKCCNSIQEAGFTPCGHYTVPQFDNMPLAGLLCEQRGIMAIVYDHPLAGCWVDFCIPFADGGSLTVSNSPMGAELDTRPGHRLIYSTEADPDKLLALLESDPLTREVLAVSPESFAPTFVRMYEEDAAWRNKRGVNTGEVERVARAMDENISAHAVKRTARRYEEPRMSREQAWDVLISWPDFQEQDSIPEELVDRFELATDYFVQNPDPRCLPIFLRCLKRDDDDGLAMFVTEVFEEHPEEHCVSTIATGLGASSPVTRKWSASLACSFPVPALAAPLATVLRESLPLDESFQYALMALDEISLAHDTRDASRAIREAVQRSSLMAAEMLDASDPVSAFLILLSVRAHHGPNERSIYELARTQAGEAGFPVAEIERLHGETFKLLANARQ